MRSLASRGVVLDAAGAGQVSIGPDGSWTDWDVHRITVSGQGAAPPRVAVYRGEPGDGTFLDGTADGNGDVADYSSPVTLYSGQFLTVLWRGGTPGAGAAVSLHGELRQAGAA